MTISAGLRAIAYVMILVVGALLAGCGGGGTGTDTAGSVVASGASRTAFRRQSKATDQQIKAAALHNRYVREVSAGGRVRVSKKVVPVVAEGKPEMIGGRVLLFLNPAVELDNQKLPTVIYPNHKAPSGTPSLYRYARWSASNVGELEVVVMLKGLRPVIVEPTGKGLKVTKAELLGPPPKNPAYAPEPGY